VLVCARLAYPDLIHSDVEPSQELIMDSFHQVGRVTLTGFRQGLKPVSNKSETCWILSFGRQVRLLCFLIIQLYIRGVSSPCKWYNIRGGCFHASNCDEVKKVKINLIIYDGIYLSFCYYDRFSNCSICCEFLD
jgi:hypothetical protein